MVSNHQNGDGCSLIAFRHYLEACLRALVSATAPPWLDQLRYPRCKHIRTSRLPTLPTSGRCVENDFYQGMARDWAQLSQSRVLIPARAFAKYLAAGYQGLAGARCSCQVDIQEKVFQIREPRVGPAIVGQYINQLEQALEPLSDGILGAYLHGSLADGEFVPGYSDCDVSVWLRADVCESPDALLFIREQLLHATPVVYAADYVQHHEFFIGSELGLQWRNAALFPDIFMNEAAYLLGRRCLVSSVEPNQERAHVAAFVRNQEFIRSGLNPRQWGKWYHLKNLLSHICLAPTLFYQAIGQPVGKREAIARLGREAADTTAALRLSTQIRQQWPGRGFGMPGYLYRRALAINLNATRMAYAMQLPTPRWVRRYLEGNFSIEVQRYSESLMQRFHRTSEEVAP